MCPAVEIRAAREASSAGPNETASRLVGVDGPSVTARAGKPEIPRLLLTRQESARSLGMSLDSFERYVQAEIRVVPRGRMRLVPVSELERWSVENAERPMVESLRGE
jgi:hypothetical protein